MLVSIDKRPLRENSFRNQRPYMREGWGQYQRPYLREGCGQYHKISGKIINQSDLKSRKKVSTNTILIHGDSDQVVSPNFLLEAKDFLIRNDVSIETHLIKNCDHFIPTEASSIALNYILKKLN